MRSSCHAHSLPLSFLVRLLIVFHRPSSFLRFLGGRDFHSRFAHTPHQCRCSQCPAIACRLTRAASPRGYQYRRRPGRREGVEHAERRQRRGRDRNVGVAPQHRGYRPHDVRNRAPSAVSPRNAGAIRPELQHRPLNVRIREDGAASARIQCRQAGVRYRVQGAAYIVGDESPKHSNT